MSDEKKDVLERLKGWGLDGLKARVAEGRKAADNGIWGMSINSARGEDSNRIGAAYSALWANAPTLFEIIDELAAEVREYREKPVEVEEVGGVKMGDMNGAKACIALLRSQLEQMTHARDNWRVDFNDVNAKNMDFQNRLSRLARELNQAKDTIRHQQGEIERLREELKKAEDDVATWQHRARECQLEANSYKANFNAELEGNRKLREKFGARDNETWSQWLERMANESATQKALAAAWKRDCEVERAKVEQISRRLDAIKKAVADE